MSGWRGWLNGNAKTLGILVGLLWTTVTVLFGRAWGAAEIRVHADMVGHPVIVERVNALQTVLDLKLETIDAKLNGISERLRTHREQTEKVTK